MHRLTTMTKAALTLLLAASATAADAAEVAWYDGKNPVTYSVQKNTEPVVEVALQMFASDMEAVTGRKAVAAAEKRAAIRLVELDKASASVRRQLQKQGVPVGELQKKIDGFHISVIGGQVTVVGANGRGTAYGLLELSRMAGVSPWIWWGDVAPERKGRASRPISLSGRFRRGNLCAFLPETDGFHALFVRFGRLEWNF